MKLTKNKKIIILFFAGFVFISLFLFADKSQAQENLKSVLKEVSEKTNQISEIKENAALSPEEKEQKDLEARKNALLKIFELTLLEDSDLKDKLNNLENLTENQEKTKNELVDLMQENENSYKAIEGRLQKAESAKDIKTLANDFRNWRAFVYNPKVEKVISFNLAMQQKNNLRTAEQRLEKIRADLEKFETMDLIKKEQYEPQLNEAILNLGDAQLLNNYAEKLLAYIVTNNLYPENTITIIKKLFLSLELKKINKELTKLNNKSLFNKEEKAGLEKNITTPATVKTYIEKSNQLLKNSYKNLIELSQLAKEKIK